MPVKLGQMVYDIYYTVLTLGLHSMLVDIRGRNATDDLEQNEGYTVMRDGELHVDELQRYCCRGMLFKRSRSLITRRCQ